MVFGWLLADGTCGSLMPYYNLEVCRDGNNLYATLRITPEVHAAVNSILFKYGRYSLYAMEPGLADGGVYCLPQGPEESQTPEPAQILSVIIEKGMKVPPEALDNVLAEFNRSSDKTAGRSVHDPHKPQGGFRLICPHRIWQACPRCNIRLGAMFCPPLGLRTPEAADGRPPYAGRTST